MVIYPLAMTFTDSSPWFVDGPNRNRWFTELNSMGSMGGSFQFANWRTVSHNQMVTAVFSMESPGGMFARLLPLWL